MPKTQQKSFEKIKTYKFSPAEKQECCLELVLLRLGHGQVFQSGLRDGHVQTLRQTSRFARGDAVVECVTEIEKKFISTFSELNVTYRFT